MRKLFFIIISVWLIGIADAQWDVSAGMGVDITYSPALTDYISTLPTIDKINSYNITAEFSAAGATYISPDWQLGAEYAMSLFSFNSVYSEGATGTYTLEYTAFKPSLLLFYVVSGKGYFFKLGGGAGYRYYDVTEKISSAIDYKTSGFGLVLRIEGHTLLSGNFYAMIGGDLRQDFPGQPSNGDKYLYDYVSNDKVNLNTFSAGLKIGISYFFR